MRHPFKAGPFRATLVDGTTWLEITKHMSFAVTIDDKKELDQLGRLVVKVQEYVRKSPKSRSRA